MLFVTVDVKREALAGEGEPIALFGLQAMAAAQQSPYGVAAPVGYTTAAASIPPSLSSNPGGFPGATAYGPPY